MKYTLLLLLVSSALLSTSCRSTTYAVKEKFGIEKRDILVDDVEEARDSQQEAKEQFTSALKQFQSVVEVEGGDLEEKYTELKKEYEDSERRAERVRTRIDEVERVSRDLFKEWEQEITTFQSDNLRRSSEDQLQQTRRKFETMLASMRNVEEKMEPVLLAFRDQVLYLKHNLNSRAIASIQTEAEGITRQIEDLIVDMNDSIDEANQFIASMER